MGRTNNIWVMNLYYDVEHQHIFKVIEFQTLREIAVCLNKPIFEISNFYHKIKKPMGVFKHLYIYKSLA